MLRRHLLLPLLTATTSLRAADVEPDAVLVVSTASPLATLTRNQAVAFFTGRVRTLPGGEPVQPLDLPINHPLRERFYRTLTGLGPAQMNSYWARLSFSGQMQPPQVVDSELAMRRALRDNPRAIGYLAKEPDDPTLRVLLVLRALPG